MGKSLGTAPEDRACGYFLSGPLPGCLSGNIQGTPAEITPPELFHLLFAASLITSADISTWGREKLSGQLYGLFRGLANWSVGNRRRSRNLATTRYPCSANLLASRIATSQESGLAKPK